MIWFYTIEVPPPFEKGSRGTFNLFIIISPEGGIKEK
jgi:hypothetical protein